MRFGVREICNVTFRPLAALDIGSQHFSAYQPCLYIDTATASNMEVATTTVYAQGGRGNARLIAWEGEKTATFTVTDALLSPISFSMLSGAGVFDETAGNKIIHLTVDGTVHKGTTSAGAAYITVEKDALAGYIPVAPGENHLNVYGMILDPQGQVVDYLGEMEISQPTASQVSGHTDEVVLENDGSWKINLTGPLKKKDPANQNETIPSKYDGYTCRIDCYAKTTNAPVTTLTVDAENFGGTFYIEAETLFRDEATGHDFPATFIIPKGKISGNFTFNMASSGDPSTFDFQIDCTVGSVRTLPSSKKVLYAIDIIDNISEGDSHVDATSTIDATNKASNASAVTLTD